MGEEGEKARRPGCLGRLFGLILLGLTVVLAWGVWANWSMDADGDGRADGFTFRVFDRDWWTVSRREARPLTERGRDLAVKARDEFEDLVARGQRWMNERRQGKARSPAGSGDDPGRPAAVDPQSRKELEMRISVAEEVFAEGMRALSEYRGMDPGERGRKARLETAIGLFARVQETLAPAVVAYAQLSGRDPDLLKEAQDLLDLDQRLLATSRRQADGG